MHHFFERTNNDKDCAAFFQVIAQEGFAVAKLTCVIGSAPLSPFNRSHMTSH